MDELELTILMPCLNEQKTVSQCVQLARQFLSESGVCGEVLVADNGSSSERENPCRAERLSAYGERAGGVCRAKEHG